MNAQAAAYRILEETGSPLPSREIAEVALDRGLVSSNSKDPVHSIATTIEKNIREGRYNEPELVFQQSGSKRLIALPSMQNGETHNSGDQKTRIQVKLPKKLLDQIQLARRAQIGESLDDTIEVLLREGLSEVAPEVKKRLIRQLEEIGE
jgi:hypothetical protein